MHTFTIQGTRGSILTGRETGTRYGIQTTGMTLHTPSGTLALDAGTGLPAALNSLEPVASPSPLTSLFTHYHLDHLVGLPLLQSVYNPRATVCLMGDPRRSWQTAVRGLFSPPFWPVNLIQAGAQLEFKDLPLEMNAVEILGIKITWCSVRHPQECLAYRLEVDGRSYVVATDREHGEAPLDAVFVRFCKGADVLIHDAQYLPEEMPAHAGWGHSTFAQAAAAAQAANVGLLVLTHHEASRTDAQIDMLVDRARKLFPNTEGATEGMTFSVANNTP